MSLQEPMEVLLASTNIEVTVTDFIAPIIIQCSDLICTFLTLYSTVSVSNEAVIYYYLQYQLNLLKI